MFRRFEGQVDMSSLHKLGMLPDGGSVGSSSAGWVAFPFVTTNPIAVL